MLTEPDLKKVALTAYIEEMKQYELPEAWTLEALIQWWEVSYDSDPQSEGFMSRRIIWDLNDDGYFVQLHAVFELWGSDDYTLAALAYKGSDDPNFVVVPIHEAS